MASMTIFEARPKRLTEGKYRYTCGRRGIETGWCPGHLGDADLAEVTYPDGSKRTEWILSHDHGLFKDGEMFRVVPPATDVATGQQTGRKTGRRPRPERLQVASGTEVVIGRNPPLPLLEACPECGRANRVDNP